MTVASALYAHEGEPTLAPITWTTWSWEPAVVVGLFVTGALYAAGLRTQRRATAARHALRREAWLFGTGWIVLVIALVSPLHPWGAQLFAAHMVQHELLMVIAAPLLVLGRPALVWLCAFPRPAARGIAQAFRRCGLDRVWHALTNVFIASLVHAFALWIWHVPALFEATANEWAHMAQHVSFLFSAVLFWQAVFYGPQRAAGHGLAVVFLFFTAMHSGALGALLTFANALWYPSYAATSPAWGLSAVEDQQLGGVIMWIPAGVIYMAAALALFARWLRESDRRRVRRESVALASSHKCAPSL